MKKLSNQFDCEILFKKTGPDSSQPSPALLCSTGHCVQYPVINVMEEHIKKKKECVCMCNRVTLLYSSNGLNFINQLHSHENKQCMLDATENRESTQRRIQSVVSNLSTLGFTMSVGGEVMKYHVKTAAPSWLLKERMAVWQCRVQL